MIEVEADVSEEWDRNVDWPALAVRAARSAVTHSELGAIIDGALGVEISIKFTSDAEIQALNAAYRGKDKPTNVLSFPMVEADLLHSIADADGGEVLLGDVVVAHGACSSEAADKGIAAEAHASHLVVHGVLHLLGYDHVGDDQAAERMEGIEREALAAIGIADPYATTGVYI